LNIHKIVYIETEGPTEMDMGVKSRWNRSSFAFVS